MPTRDWLLSAVGGSQPFVVRANEFGNRKSRKRSRGAFTANDLQYRQNRNRLADSSIALHKIVTVRRIFSDEPAENGTGTVPHFGGFPFPFVPDLCSVRTRYSCRPRLYLAQLN